MRNSFLGAGLVAVVAVVILIGIATQLFSSAATSFVTVDPEDGVPTGTATRTADGAASKGAAVRFASSAAGTGSFTIVGSDIVDPDGNKFFPVGANVGIRNGFDWKGVANGRSADALAWGWNTVRLTLYCGTGAEWMPINRDGYAPFLQQVHAFVQEYTAKKIVVMIECHDLTGDADVMTHRGELDRFWGDMAVAHKANPYVWFNPANEPYWAQNASWLPFHVHYYDLIRSKGAQNIIVADAMNMGNDTGWDGAKRIYDDTMGPALVRNRCNVLLSLHAYGGMGGNSEHKTYFEAVRAKNLPLIIGEYGYTLTNPDPYYFRGAQAVHAVAPGMGVGMLVWHGTHGDGMSLKNSGNAFYADGGPGANLSPLGQGLWNIGHNKPVLGKFTGDYSRSNCPAQ